jgi:hypothetical protein
MDEQMIPQTPDVSQVKTNTSTSTVTTGPPDGNMQAVKGSWLPGIIAVMLTVALIAFGGGLFFRAIPPENKDLVNTMFGGLIVGCTTAWGYFFTSNQASEARSALRISKGTP